MKHRIAHAPTFTTLEIDCAAGESVWAQPGCMLAMTTGFDLSAGLGSHMSGKPGIRQAARSLFAGESFFTAKFTAKRDGEQLILAPAESGEIRGIEIAEGFRYCIASGAFLACTTGIQIALQYVGMKGWLATRGLYLMRTEGTGSVFLSSYGSLVERTLAEGEKWVLDNRYIVAFSETMKFEMVKVTSSIKTSLLSGEGLVNRFTGPGKLFYQTRARPKSGFLQGILNFAS